MGAAAGGRVPALPVACWRVKGDPSQRLATGEWKNGEPDFDTLDEYARLGWKVEVAHPADVAAGLIQDRARLSALLEELLDIEGPQPGHVEWARKVQAELVRLKLQALPSLAARGRAAASTARQGSSDDR